MAAGRLRHRPGFYDTRFNTDLLEIYIKAARKFGKGMFDETITRYLGFFSQIADTSHISTESGGWLIPDYWHPSEITGAAYLAQPSGSGMSGALPRVRPV